MLEKNCEEKLNHVVLYYGVTIVILKKFIKIDIWINI